MQINAEFMPSVTVNEAPDSCNILPPGQTKSESPVDNGSQTHVEPVFNQDVHCVLGSVKDSISLIGKIH